MFIIEEGSDTFAILKRMVNEHDTRKITIAVHETNGEIMLKRNEHMWTLPLQVTVVERG